MKQSNLQRAVEIDKRLKGIAALKTQLTTSDKFLNLQITDNIGNHATIHFTVPLSLEEINGDTKKYPIMDLVADFVAKLLKAIDAEAAELKKELTGL